MNSKTNATQNNENIDNADFGQTTWGDLYAKAFWNMCTCTIA